MPSNVYAVPLDRHAREASDERLPPRAAALGIVALSLLGWAMVLVPLFAFLHF
jgi:hypothetical protein